jgi:ribonuclease J
MADTTLRVIPLGGLGEFGMNCMALECGGDIIVVDAGMMFPDDELPGVDIVTPDFAFLEENRSKIRALILTHGHEDHIGACPFLLNAIDVPVYGTAFALALVERRLDEHGMTDDVCLNTVKPGDRVAAGCFDIEFINVTHSIVSSLALAIATPLGVVIHTGDFKVDPTPTDNQLFDLHTFAEYGKRGVLLLLSDSTNVDRPGFTPSERAVRPRLEDLFVASERRLILSCFSSSIHRLQQVLDLAQEHGRKVCFLGRSMISATEIAHSLGLLEIPNGILLRPQDLQDYEPSKVCAVVSGTQGEPMSSLSRVAVDSHRHLSIRAGDTVALSARIIPGNEKAIFRLFDHLTRRGAEVIYGDGNPPLHVSGHASAEELKLILNLVRPKYFIPVHGQHRQLSQHAKLAQHLHNHNLKETFVLDTGDTVIIDERGARRGERVKVGRICIDSGSLDDVVQEMVIKERRHLAEDGFVVPILAINRSSGDIEGVPEVVSRGFVSPQDSPALMSDARAMILKTIEGSNAEERSDVAVMQEKIRVDLKRFFNKQTSRRPLILPVVLEI